MSSIILVEDNLRVSEELCLVLQKSGMSVRCADNAESFRQLVAEETPEIVVIDLNLPGEDGISLCKWLRTTYTGMGIVMLTARVMGSDRAEGYVAGADVYLTKPTRPEELLAVIRNLSRLTHSESQPQDHGLAGSWTLQFKGLRLISPHLEILSLTPSELILLRELAVANQYCGYQRLIHQLGGDGSPEKTEKARLEVLISRLRAKLQRMDETGFEIKTEHGKGYRLTAPLRLQPKQ